MLNTNNAKTYARKILDMYKNIEHTKKKYVGFEVVNTDIHILREEAEKAFNNLKHISEVYDKMNISNIKIFIFSYILLPLVCSKCLPESYLAYFNENIAPTDNLDNIKDYVDKLKVYFM